MTLVVRAFVVAFAVLLTASLARPQTGFDLQPRGSRLQATPPTAPDYRVWQTVYPTPVHLASSTNSDALKWGASPTYVAQSYDTLVATQPAFGEATCPPCPPLVYAAPAFDPYACSQQPVVGCPTAACPGICTEPIYSNPVDPWRNSYFEGEAQLGDVPTTGRGSVFVPTFQDQNSYLFFDIRGQWDDEQAAEGNFGIGGRRYFDAGYFATLYGFYDFRHTQLNNNFHGVTVGADVFNLQHEARMNWYIPEGGGQPAPGFAQAQRSGNAIVVAAGVERAYYGFDAEVGHPTLAGQRAVRGRAARLRGRVLLQQTTTRGSRHTAALVRGLRGGSTTCPYWAPAHGWCWRASFSTTTSARHRASLRSRCGSPLARTAPPHA